MEIGTGLDDKRQTAIQEQESTIQEQLERAKRAGWMMRVRISGTSMTSGTIGCITGIVMLLDLPGLLNTIVHRGNADRCEYRALITERPADRQARCAHSRRLPLVLHDLPAEGWFL